jgi:glycosyltransferase involved in cell wall biosynthesis
MSKITVLLPVYNTAKYIENAIKSILNQTFTDFELLIINDGSTDKSVEIIKTFKDKRIQLIHNPVNLGLIKALNKGINLAKGKYIARMDADDVTMPNRLEKQVAFLENNPEYALVGTQANFIFGDKLSKTLFSMETSSEILPVLSLFSCPFIHPSVMIKTAILKEFYYNEGFTAAEDYELWTRILKKYPCANLSESLLQYRIHDNNISTTQNDKQIDSVRRIYRANLEHILMPYTESDLDIYLKISDSYHKKISLLDLESMSEWLVKMQLHLLKEGIYDKNAVRKIIGITWLNVCSKVRYNGMKVFWVYLFQWDFDKSNFGKVLKLFLQCVLSSSIFKPLYEKIRYIYRHH